MSGWALVAADEDMLFKFGHEENVQYPCSLGVFHMEHWGEAFHVAILGLVFQGHHWVITSAEGGYMLEAAGGMLHQHDGTVAEDGVAVFCHVPHAGLARLTGCEKIERLARRRREFRTG